MGSKRDKLKRAVRKTVKWGGLVATVLLLAVWIGSGRFWLYVSMTPGASIDVANGLVIVGFYKTEPFWGWPQLLLRDSHSFQLAWLGIWHSTTPRTMRFVPLWPLPLLSFLATAAAWRADAKYLRRARVGRCPACGYDRAGLAAGAVCPECGSTAAA